MEYWCKTDKGLRRDSNQDSYLVNPDLGLFVVADGMGGHSGGEVASSMAVKAVEEFVKDKNGAISSSRDLVSKAYEEASHRIYDRASFESPELSGMGTTMVCLYHSGTSMFIGNVGDSRCYLFRKPFLWQVTEDHSLINEQLRAGILREDQLKTVGSRNVITRSVGYEREVVPDVLERSIQMGDSFLVCSDGFSGLVEDPKIAEILNSTSNGEDIVNKCIEAALQAGGDDNVTVLYIRVG